MSREALLAETFVSLADTLIDDYDPIEFMQLLSERCVELLDVSAAGIMLADRAENLRHAACSDERMRLVELLELQFEEGPCLDTYRTGTPENCASLQDAHDRWPRFAPYAQEAGFEAAASVPLRLRSQRIGSLNLFSSRPVALSDSDLALAQAMADVATIGVLHERALRDSHTVVEQLEGALNSRVLIEQAKGIVAEREHIHVDEAFTRIRNHARTNSQRLTDTAHAIITGELPSSFTHGLHQELRSES